MESWRKVWRDGFAPLLSTPSLLALADALETNDRRLIQGATTTPPPFQCVADRPVEAGCAIGYCGWKGEGLETVAEVEEFFAKLCHAADVAIGEPAGCRWFLNYFDETPRAELFPQLLAEVRLALDGRTHDVIAETLTPTVALDPFAAEVA